jgi:branched-subunit amino acid transport protein
MTNTEWILILGMALVTFGIRYVLLALANRIELPELLKESLKFIAPAVLTAITVPAVLMPSGEMAISFSNPYLISAGLAVVAGILSKNVLITIVAGLSGFIIFQVLV